MGFLAPWMLFGAVAAAIPVILHFFYRSRFRDVPWAAMKFLLAAIEQTSRRLKFQELLLLILRVLLLLLLAFALARPTSSGGAGRGDAVDAAIILDTSLSMQASAGLENGSPSTCFDRARAAARKVLSNLPPHSTVAIIAASAQPRLLGPGNPGHLEGAKGIVDGMSADEAGSDAALAFAEAERFLQRGPSPNKEAWFLSDMQRGGVDAKAAELKARLGELARTARVCFVHCRPQAKRNVSLAGITPQTALRSGERADFAVLVRNTGKESARNLVVALSIDGAAPESQALPEVKPGETQAVVLGGKLDRPGRHVLSATVKPDDLEGDNRLDQVVHVNDQVGILVVDGSPGTRDPTKSASFFLLHAINPVLPGMSGLPVTVVPADRASPRDLGGKELCIVVNARLEAKMMGEVPLSPDFVRELGAFVKSGKGAMIVLGDKAAPGAYNRALWEQARLLPYKLGAKIDEAARDAPWKLDRATAESPPFDRFKQEKGYATLDRIEVRKAWPVLEAKEEEDSRVLLRLTSGKPAIVARKKPGEGEVVLFTTALGDPEWNDWAVSPSFVPSVQVALSHLLEGRPGDANRVAGEPLSWQVPKGEEEAAFDLVPPVGERARLGFAAEAQGRHVLTASETGRAGLYRLAGAGKEPGDAEPLFAVAPDLRETESLETLPAEEIDRLLGIKAVHVQADDDGSFSGAERLKREWTLWLLLALLVLVACEMVLAWHCGRAW
ncbi:MAG: BatA domain-containing protein [Gemmataceae bacterium]|nr:BatA domain-containing protein [Gemmataceae bacterium]